MSIGQSNRVASITTPLGDDKLVLQSMTANEQLGRLFEIVVELLSEDESIQLSDALGQPFTVKTETRDDSFRYFHGNVSQFASVGREGKLAKYRATLVPWLWFLSRTADCRIFQEKNAPDIIKEVFRDNGFSDFETKLSGTYRTWNYCVQYRETDFDFVSRLMEHEGIYYYFKHEANKHVLVLSDDYGSHTAFSGYSEVDFIPPGNENVRDQDHISQWAVSQQVRSKDYVLTDFDFEKPKADLQTNSMINRSHALNSSEIFDYPGQYAESKDGTEYVKKRIQEQQACYEVAQGSGNARGLMCGALFTLSGYPRDDQNREYLIESTRIELRSTDYETGLDNSEADFECSFKAIESRTPFRSPRSTPKPVVKGPQTAMVVGKNGEEIWTDKYGRVKVQFHWDRYGKSDENSSCWVRVAQVWAGKTWGAIHIPRIGQEVIVDFLEGDPDQPIITGRVYNADQMPPYTLPSNQTQSGIKSRSTKQGTGDTFNELRFEDKKGEELIYLHAEKDFTRIVENNDSLEVGLEKKDKGDQTIKIHNNQTLTVGNNQSKDGSQTITVWKNVTESVETGDQKLDIKKGSRTVTINTDDTLTVKTGNQSIKISAGKNVTQAAQSILLKCGASSIKIEPAKITMKSPQISIAGDATVDVKAAMTSCKGSAVLTLSGGLTKIN